MRGLAVMVLTGVLACASAQAQDRPDRYAQQQLRPGGGAAPPGAPAPAGAPAGGGTASGTLVDASDVNRLAALMQGWGWLAKVGKDSSGDPKIESKISKTTFSVTFYGCTKGKDCSSVSLETAYAVDKPVDMEAINKWNREKRWGQAALNVRNNPMFSLAINLDGGVSPKNLESTFERWRTNVTAFETVIGW